MGMREHEAPCAWVIPLEKERGFSWNNLSHVIAKARDGALF